MTHRADSTRVCRPPSAVFGWPASTTSSRWSRLALGTEGHMTTMPRIPSTWRSASTKQWPASIRSGRSTDVRCISSCSTRGHRRRLEVVGTSAIYAAVGLDRPFYNYKVTRLSKYSPEIDRRFDYTILQPSNDYAGCTEVGTLYLPEDRRGGGRGRLLSFARFHVPRRAS
ncbi:MAG: arginine N-succinyltransferase [Acidimicrobiales bacterium]